MMDVWSSFVLGSFSVWRITHLLHAEDGPWDAFAHFRRGLGNSFLGQLTDCFYCLSLWVALPIAGLLAQSWLHGVLLWLALSAAAILLERCTTPKPPIFPPNKFEER